MIRPLGISSLIAQKSFNITRDALREIAIIYRELNLVLILTVAENLLLGHFPQRSVFLNKQQMFQIAQKQIEELMEEFGPTTKVKNLSIGQRQMLQVGKRYYITLRLSHLTNLPVHFRNAKWQHNYSELLNAYSNENESDCYVSHRMNEIFKICDTVTVFRDGKRIETFTNMKDVTHNLLVQRMVGREIKDVYGYRSRQKAKNSLEVKQLRGKGLKLKDISFDVSRGEIVGFSGLVGAGRSELLKVIFGAASREIQPDFRQWAVCFNQNPTAAIRHGICLSPEDRKDEGIIPLRSVSENINISCRRHFLRAGIFLNKKKEQENTDHFIAKLAIKTPSRNQLIGNLSGGNQQKTI